MEISLWAIVVGITFLLISWGMHVFSERKKRTLLHEYKHKDPKEWMPLHLFRSKNDDSHQ